MDLGWLPPDGFTTFTNLTTTATPAPYVRKGPDLRAIAGATCALSIVGSFIIILSYFLFRNLRTNARLILVHLSLSDLGVSLSNLTGISIHFGRYFNHTTKNLNHLESLCETQAFIAHYFTISSVLWTLMLATYMYVVTTKLSRLSKKENRWFNIFSCMVCYGASLFNAVWMLVTHRLGYSPANTSGWCGTIEWKMKEKKVDYVAIILGYDVWIGLTCVFIIVIYMSLLCYIRQEKKNHEDFREVARNIDYKFILIPLMFVLLRVWSFLVDILFFVGHRKSTKHIKLHLAFLYLAGIGDSGQGAANAILFVIFTHNVRHRYLKLLCWCFSKKYREEDKRVLVVNRLDSSLSSSTPKIRSSIVSSNPMYIEKSLPPGTKKYPMVTKSCDTTSYGSIPSSDSD